jgi:hypothetical protein
MRKNTLMKSLAFLVVTMLALGSASAYDITTNTKTRADVEYVETILQAGYGFTGANVTCSAFNLEVPQIQTSDTTVFRAGFYPICDVNYTDYLQYLTLYCNGEYIETWNYTADCGSGAGNLGENTLITLIFGNLTSNAVNTQRVYTVSCQLCVNNSSTAPRTDFFTDIDLLVSVKNEVNETVVEGADIIIDGILSAVNVTVLLIDILELTLTILVPIWGLVLTPVLVIWLARNLVERLKAMIPKRKK